MRLLLGLIASGLLACTAPRQFPLPVDQTDAATATTTADAAHQGEGLSPASAPDAAAPMPDTTPNATTTSIRWSACGSRSSWRTVGL